ncbi:two-component sensor protein histidine protein kinase [Cordyceps fumosorosea ARSEF 2679]|uniref:histidine kinase n=1 Tax=Cordyceps fumosorosea (strain ARSEF 2679) TaxID=1081104 RepID=A0A167VV84_CORFA|nr:two-component sensor protein histidine protein kinase [Cordyceps fumosorosea ARSEF 2679]OAA63017.1 two-component sensor protein histidine protein kinase [Cordyceps fumosorosea ARSEF 2679]
MVGAAVVAEEALDPPPPPPRLFERLRQIAGYTWDESIHPIHSTYDYWYIFGTRLVPQAPTPSASSHHLQSAAIAGKLRPSTSDHGAGQQTPTSALDGEPFPSPSIFSRPPSTASSTSATDSSYAEEPIVARISLHTFREERAFQIAKNFLAKADPNAHHIVRPLDLMRLPPTSGDRSALVVAIYQRIGPNYLFDVLDMGPALYRARKDGESYQSYSDLQLAPRQTISLEHFLDFAIGAAECLEILHHHHGMIHGELRGDAFHFNVETNQVRIVSFGSGLRSFEHGLTSTGWSTLSKEIGAKNKLLYISPEQTGRMPAEPDSRTDIYSLGVLFWTLLTRQPVFSGDNPLDIVQGVLNKKIPNVTTVRLGIPDVIGRIIQRCTAKNVADRYLSASGLRHDLVLVQEHLGNGDLQALADLHIGSKDVSSFFLLPTVMIGRDKERNELLRVIDRVSRSHSVQARGPHPKSSDGSSFHNDAFLPDDASSEGASSTGDGNTRRSASFTQTSINDQRLFKGSFQSSAPADSHNSDSASTSHSINTLPAPRIARRWERHQSMSNDTNSAADSSGYDGSRHGGVDSGASTLSRQLGTAKFRRRGHCEVVVIDSAGGLGKSCLIQSVLPDIRRRGYCATAKFDSARRAAHGPLIKLLSSLFKQVWGERNTDTPFHQALKQYVRPVWPMLHKTLGLPEFLLGPADTVASRTISLSQSSGLRNNGRVGKRRGSSPGISPGPSGGGTSIASQTAHDFLRVGASTKTRRFVNTFLDVLRVFTHHKLICFCLEDLHFADEESLELVSQVISARMRMVIILTHRPEELSAEKMQSVVYSPEIQELPKSSRPTITKLKLAPFTEAEVLKYVAATLARPTDDILQLAMAIQSKTAGNPFYIREMLSICNRKRCIWYDYRDSQWHYDLDKIFAQFQGEKDFELLDTDFITRRLNELPPAARAVLAWAALIGSSFSFELICRLMHGEYNFEDGAPLCAAESPMQSKYTEGEAIEGLQAAVQAYILVQSETEDRFRFAHDRYIHASSGLKECNEQKMHFIIAQTLMKYYPDDSRERTNVARHICKAVPLIKTRIPKREHFRKLLTECAQDAVENGARPTASKYYSKALQLLQPGPWDPDSPDVSYDETLRLHLRTAECYLYMSKLSKANDLLSIIFSNAKTPLDKAPAYVLQSRIFAQNGNSLAALISLKDCMATIGVDVEREPTYEACDKKFEELATKIKSMDRSTITAARTSNDQVMASIGAVLSESLSAAWWSDCLEYYYLTLVMLDTHLTRGAFPQSGVAFLNMGVVALCRFSMAEFAVELGVISQDLLYDGRDTFSIARGQMLHTFFLAHIHCSMPVSVAQTEDAIELASVGGDRMSTILSYGLTAHTKFFASENLDDLESYCQFACEEIPTWYSDTRGGAMIVAIRQTCRALQGKTHVGDALGIMSDDHHNGPRYKTWLTTQTQESNRSLLLYESVELVNLFLYGHYERAVELGRKCYNHLDAIWSARNSRLTLLFYGLARAGQLLRQMQDPRSPTANFSAQTQEIVKEMQGFVDKIQQWSTVSDVNYLCWSRLLEAQVVELVGDHGEAVQHYEEALDHASEHGFVFEEALGNYLMAGFFLRRRARRSARSALLETVGLYRQLGATGVARAIEEEHCLLLRGPTRSHQTADAAMQTDFVTDTSSVQYPHVDGEDDHQLNQVNSHTLMEVKGDRIGAWRGSMDMQSDDVSGLPTLDMIDLHAILVSSQVISSVLQIDELLKTMCDVILQTCGGSATLAAIVVQDPDAGDNSWCIAASGDPEKGASAHNPGLPLAANSLIADNVVLYCTRFREAVFIPDLSVDERAGNVNDTWLQKNPLGRSIIAIPIAHGDKPLLGVLYMEGEPRSFTDRNVTVLQLLVNQLAISYSNAHTMRDLEKVSAENRSMVSVQRRALEKAIKAETKAKDAEAEANRNVKLAEEAAKAKSIFLANVSHELRTPLNGVIGNSELLRDSDLNREQLEMADSIRVSADLLLTVINDILDFSKMEADKMKLYIIAFNPEEMVREVVRAVSYSNREKTSKKNVKIIQDINLPSMLIYGDPIRLHQVLGNLIGNSLKFTEDGSITIGARLDSETAESATLTFWVRDTGIGIQPQQLAKLFQPFSQADAGTARKYGGSGLGLSICKSLIEVMMKGKIQLESEETVGTTAWFTVTFEKTKADVLAGDALAKSSPLIERYSSLSPSYERATVAKPPMNLSKLATEDIRVCIAEDNPINQKIAIQYVKRLGYRHVVAYENGMKAIEGLRAKAKDGQPYHIILMDVMMPVLDGYEATKLIRKDPIEAVRKILVIAMTASAIQGDREKCLAAGMNDYLAKPVRADVLRRKLDAYVNAPENPFPTPSPSPLEISQAEYDARLRAVSESAKEQTFSRQALRTDASMDPMEEGAVFNQPLDSEGLRACDSPIFGSSAPSFVHRSRSVHSSTSRTPSPLEVPGDKKAGDGAGRLSTDSKGKAETENRNGTVANGANER